MYWKSLGVAFVALVAVVCLDVIFLLDFHRRYFKHHPGTCKVVEGTYFGCEDFQILSGGLVFITSGIASKMSTPSFWHFLKVNDIKGRILLMDLSVSNTTINEVKIRPSNSFDSTTFRPHGLSVLEDSVKGEHLIYVVNHIATEEDRVEKFKYLPGTKELEHVRSFSSPLIHLANDIDVTAEDNFFVTNCGYFENPLVSFIEQISRLPLHDVLYYNGNDFKIAVAGLSGPNGVTVSKDGRHVYVGMLLTKSVRVYVRQNALDHSLELVQEIYLGTAVDNFHLSEGGNILYSGNHPIFSKLIHHMGDPRIKTPSQVLSFPLNNGLIIEDEVTELFYDHGDLISGSTIGTVYKNKMYIGSFLHKLVVCDLTN